MIFFLELCYKAQEMDDEKRVSEMNADVIKGSIFFMCSSVFMILINKAVTTYSAIAVSILIFYQNLATLFILKCKNWNTSEVNYTVLKHWLPCAFFFTINIYSSLQSLRYINVATFSIFRNMQPLLVFVITTVVLNFSAAYIQDKETLHKIERIRVLNPTLDVNSLAFLSYIVLGTLIYAANDLEFCIEGYTWACIHILSMSLYSIAVKYKIVMTVVVKDLEPSLQSEEEEAQPTNDVVVYDREMGAEEMSWYNNVISLPILLFCLVAEFSVQNMHHSKVNASLHKWIWEPVQECFWPETEAVPMCPAIVLSSFFGSYFVSVSGFYIQKLITPISWLTLNNASKIPAIILSVVFFRVLLNQFEICGLVVSLSAAYFYSVAQKNSAVFSDLLGIMCHVIYFVIFMMIIVVHYTYEY